MVEMAIGEKTTLEELGGARMHCTVSGCGDVLAASDEKAIELAKRYLAYMPGSFRETPARVAAAEPKPGRSIDEIVPYDQRKWFDMYEVIDRVIDAGSWFEVKRLFAQEVIVGLARIDGRAVGIVANQPTVNAVYYNKLMERPGSERAAYVKAKRDEYAQDVDVYKLASEMLVDDIVPGASLRAELIKRLAHAESKAHEFPQRRNAVFPV